MWNEVEELMTRSEKEGGEEGERERRGKQQEKDEAYETGEKRESEREI